MASTSSISNTWKIVCLFDKSGSMESMMKKKPTAVDSINEFILSQKGEGENNNTMSLILFDDLLTEVFLDVNVNSVLEIKSSDFKPDGSTALMDAVGKTIERFSSDPNVFIVILTDGQENSSINFTMKDINNLIREHKLKGWRFKFLGTNQDSWNVGHKMGLDRDDCHNFEPNSTSMTNMMRAISTNVTEGTQPGVIRR